MLARYGEYRENKIPGADQNQYRCLAVERGICKGQKKKTSKIKYPGQTKTSTAALRLREESVKARGRKPRK
jgi:hypothetical protein